MIQNQQLYIGTSNGLYTVALQPLHDLSFSKGDFSLVQNTSGQSWGLSLINNKLLLGHHEGAFYVNKNTATSFSTKPGFWNFTPLGNMSPASIVVGGTYRGLTIFDAKANELFQTLDIPNFIESSRYVTIDAEENIWVSHPYHGVYKIEKNIDEQYTTKQYQKKEGLPALLNNHIYKIKNRIVVGTENGVYEYNSEKERFEVASSYTSLIGNQSIRYLKEDKEGNIWFIHEKVLGVIDYTGNQPQVIYIPELNAKMLSGFEYIYAIDGSNIFLGGEKGFYHINYEKYKKLAPALNVQIRSVHIIDNLDSTLFGGYFKNVNENQMQEASNIPQVAYRFKTMHFDFTSVAFGFQNNLEYSYRLKGFENNWSAWTKRTEKEYTNLVPGSYTFEVKVRNNLGNESAVSSYQFKINAPWYRTLFAYLLYFIAIGFGVYKLHIYQRKKFKAQQQKYEQEQQRLRYIHELEINKSETDIVTLQNEKLEVEIEYKNSELASSAMHIVKKGELLTKVKSELGSIIKKIDNEYAITELKKMVKALNDDENLDQEWEYFTKHFDKVHSDFIVKLKEKHSNISNNELKLCAYLRMNLSTKEIAQLMNISVRGVEISRYRLRKKLNLATDTNLFDYLISIG
jgi:DNA-binding CsgD family transcriptional regulator